jgi:nucleoside-diphosphate-sugar epimerase
MSGAGSSVLVTGASGFVGGALLSRILAEGFAPRAATRHALRAAPSGIQVVPGGELGSDFDWTPALSGCRMVVHAAGRAHIVDHSASNSLKEFRRVNVEGTLTLARQAVEAGVGRFVFLSSIKVSGERTLPGKPFTAADIPAPEDAYGISKHEAEQGLRALAAKTGIEVVCIRPVLVYGPGVKANFRTMMRWLHRGVPLPLGALYKKRSLVGIDNLVDFVVTCLRLPQAANKTFLVSDGEDLSTTELLQRLSVALGRAPRLIPVSERLLGIGVAFIGRQSGAKRLLESLQVDITPTQELLNWRPPVSIDEGLQSTAKWFLQRGR